MRFNVLVFVCLGACASPPVPAPASPSDPPVVVRAAPAGPGAVTARPGAAAEPECRTSPEPVVVVAPPSRACPQVAKKVQAELRPRLEQAYRPTAPGARLAEKYGCDGLGPVWELVFETGTGHGQGLTLVRLRWRGDKVEGLRISRRDPLAKGGGGVQVERVVADSVDLDRVMPALRGLTLVQLEEVVPPDPRGGSAHGSSGSWHGLLRLADPAGHVRERGFTGSSSSDMQLQSIPVAEIAATLRPLVDALAWQTAAVDDDARSLFVSRFLAAGPDRAAWWVKERLVVLAADIGTPALIPRLVALAQGTRVDASMQRTREHALAALAVLTGFDARRDSQGAPVASEAAAATYARICKQ